MPSDDTIAVEATDPKYFGLKHMPGRIALDADGKGTWPADHFTFRLMEDGSIRPQGSPTQANVKPVASP